MQSFLLPCSGFQEKCKIKSPQKHITTISLKVKCNAEAQNKLAKNPKSSTFQQSLIFQNVSKLCFDAVFVKFYVLYLITNKDNRCAQNDKNVDCLEFGRGKLSQNLIKISCTYIGLSLHTCQILFNNNSSSFRQKQQEHKQWWKLQKAWDVREEIWSQNQLGFSPRKIQSSLPSASYWRGWRRRGGVRWRRGWDFQGSRLQALSTLLDRRESWTRHWWTWSQEPEENVILICLVDGTDFLFVQICTMQYKAPSKKPLSSGHVCLICCIFTRNLPKAYLQLKRWICTRSVVMSKPQRAG